MIRLGVVLLLAAVTGVTGAIVAPQPAAAATSWRAVTATTLNVRATPSLSGRIVAKLPKGARVADLGRSGPWMKIWSGRWVYAAYTAPATTSNTSAWVVVSSSAPGTGVSYATSRQVMVADRSSGTTGTWRRWEWRTSTGAWHRVSGSALVSLGYGGMKPAARRIAGDGSTPTGTFTIPYTFGTSNPGTRMTYRQIRTCSWWIGSPKATDYNRWRESCSIPAAIRADSENLYYYGYQRSDRPYRQAAVIGFNYANPIRTGPGSGSAIFLHYSAPGHYSTAGCVGLRNVTELSNTIRWLDPAKSPRIVITA